MSWLRGELLRLTLFALADTAAFSALLLAIVREDVWLRIRRQTVCNHGFTHGFQELRCVHFVCVRHSLLSVELSGNNCPYYFTANVNRLIHVQRDFVLAFGEVRSSMN